MDLCGRNCFPTAHISTNNRGVSLAPLLGCHHFPDIAVTYEQRPSADSCVASIFQHYIVYVLPPRSREENTLEQSQSILFH